METLSKIVNQMEKIFLNSFAICKRISDLKISWFNSTSFEIERKKLWQIRLMQTNKKFWKTRHFLGIFHLQKCGREKLAIFMEIFKLRNLSTKTISLRLEALNT